MSFIPNGLRLDIHAEKTSNCYAARSPEFQMMTSSPPPPPPPPPLSSLLYFSLASTSLDRQLCSTTIILIRVTIIIGSIRNKFVEQITEKLAFLYE